MGKWLTNWIDFILKESPREPFAIQSRTRFFVGTLSLTSVALPVLMVISAIRLEWGAVAAEGLLLLFLSALLVLVRRGQLALSLGIYAVGLPVMIVARFFTVLLDPASDRSALYSDYLLTLGMVTQVFLTLVSARSWHLVLGALVFALAEALSVGLLVPGLAPGARMAVLVAPVVRFFLLLSLLVFLLVLLQRIIARATRLSLASERQLEALVEERTRSLRETQGRLDRARAVLASGERQSSVERLVAGLAHEINTPLAAIRASQGSLASQVPSILEAWTGLAPQIGSAQVLRLMALVGAAQTDVSRVDSRSIRDSRARWAAWLAERSVPGAEAKARTLAELGLDRMDEEWLPLLREPLAELYLERAVELVDLERSVSIIGIASGKAADSVSKLRRLADPPDRARGPVDLGLSVKTVVDLERSQRPADLRVTLRFPPSGPWIVGSSDRLLQVWKNLMDNATQAMAGTGTLELEGESVGPWVEVRVIDDGPGIPEDRQQFLLEPFFSAKPAADGLGLGLEIVRAIVEDHGGQVAFESRPGRTVFTIRFPSGSPSPGHLTGAAPR